MLAQFYFLSIAAPWGAEGLGQGGAYGSLQLQEDSLGTLKMASFVAIVVLPPVIAPQLALFAFALGMALLGVWAPHPPLGFVRAHSTDLTGMAVCGAFFYAFLHPILGLQMMASSTMCAPPELAAIA